MGLPGDRLEVRKNRLYVNDELVAIGESEGGFEDDSGRVLILQREHLAGCDHAVLDDPLVPGGRKSPVIIPPGRYFMMGDNRDHSNDSRGWGTVSFADIQGPAFILYWSWDVNGNFLQFLNPLNWWSAEKRWGRVFSAVRCLEPGEALADRGAESPSGASELAGG